MINGLKPVDTATALLALFYRFLAPSDTCRAKLPIHYYFLLVPLKLPTIAHAAPRFSSVHPRPSLTEVRASALSPQRNGLEPSSASPRL